MAHVSNDKKKVVEEISKLIDSYPVIAVVDMANLATKQVQSMRAKLRAKKTVLRMTKKRLMKIAFQQSKKPQIQELAKHLEGMPALVFTNDNPFKLYAELQKTKSKAPAKSGQKAPKDIIVPAGPTSFSPGPVIGQLGKFGIKTGIEGGKIVVKSDSTAAHKGDTINAELAGILQRLGIEPMEIGLNLTIAYESGLTYAPEVLFVDDKAYMAKFTTAFNESLNLAVYTGYASNDTIKILIAKAYKDSKAVSLACVFVTPETANDILGKAYFEMLSVSGKLPDDALSEELKGLKTSTASVTHTDEGHHHEDKKQEKPKEEDSAAGLGALFG